MRVIRIAGLLLLVIGAAILVFAVVTGEMQVGLVLIIPVIYGSSVVGAVAILLLIGGMTLLMLGTINRGYGRGTEEMPPDRKEPAQQGQKEFGGVVLIGPVPIVFGSGNRSALLALFLMAILVMALMLTFLFLLG